MLLIVIVMVATAANYEIIYIITITLLYHTIWDDDTDNHLYCLYSDWSLLDETDDLCNK